jgi:hypothetical protein
MMLQGPVQWHRVQRVHLFLQFVQETAPSTGSFTRRQVLLVQGRKNDGKHQKEASGQSVSSWRQTVRPPRCSLMLATILRLACQLSCLHPMCPWAPTKHIYTQQISYFLTQSTEIGANGEAGICEQKPPSSRTPTAQTAVLGTFSARLFDATQTLHSTLVAAHRQADREGEEGWHANRRMAANNNLHPGGLTVCLHELTDGHGPLSGA